MHELSLLENVREILDAHALEQRFTKVTQVTIEVGKLSCVDPEALRFGFDVVMKGSLAENADLIMVEMDGVGYCRECRQQVSMRYLYDACPDCGNPVLDVTQGLELKVRDLIVI